MARIWHPASLFAAWFWWILCLLKCLFECQVWSLSWWWSSAARAEHCFCLLHALGSQPMEPAGGHSSVKTRNFRFVIMVSWRTSAGFRQALVEELSIRADDGHPVFVPCFLKRLYWWCPKPFHAAEGHEVICTIRFPHCNNKRGPKASSLN